MNGRQGAVISSQVLGEFFNVVTRKIVPPMAAAEARDIIGDLSMLEVVDVDATLVARAVDTHIRYGISYWDSLIVAGAERSSCEKLLSEDLGAGQRYHDVVVENPFAD